MGGCLPSYYKLEGSGILQAVLVTQKLILHQDKILHLMGGHVSLQLFNYGSIQVLKYVRVQLCKNSGMQSCKNTMI